MYRFINSLGSFAIESIEFFIFMFQNLLHILSPKYYTKYTNISLIKELYISIINNLSIFILFALIFGSVIIVAITTFIINFNLKEQIGILLVSIMIDEFSPIFTTFFLMLNYSLYTHLVVANNQKETNQTFSRVYLPKLIAGIVSVVSMSFIFATIMVLSGFVVSLLYLDIDLLTYKSLIINAIMVQDIVILLLKGIVFGYIISSIPIYYAQKSNQDNRNKIKYIIKTLIGIFMSILILEAIFYITKGLI